MNEEIKLDFARCFQGISGQKVLAYLREMTIERTVAAQTPSNVLYYREGQKALVKQIEMMIKKGRME